MIDFLNRIKDIKDEGQVKRAGKKYVKKEVSAKAAYLVLSAVDSDAYVTADNVVLLTGYYRGYVVRILNSLFKKGLLSRKRDLSNMYSYVYTKKEDVC